MILKKRTELMLLEMQSSFVPWLRKVRATYESLEREKLQLKIWASERKKKPVVEKLLTKQQNKQNNRRLKELKTEVPAILQKSVRLLEQYREYGEKNRMEHRYTPGFAKSSSAADVEDTFFSTDPVLWLRRR